MSEYTIQIGMTSETAHIGIQPPVESLYDQIIDELRGQMQGGALGTVAPVNGPEYSDLKLDAIRMVEEGLTSKNAAERIAGIIRANDDTVEIQPDIISLGKNHTLFELSAAI